VNHGSRSSTSRLLLFARAFCRRPPAQHHPDTGDGGRLPSL